MKGLDSNPMDTRKDVKLFQSFANLNETQIYRSYEPLMTALLENLFIATNFSQKEKPWQFDILRLNRVDGHDVDRRPNVPLAPVFGSPNIFPNVRSQLSSPRE